MKELLKKIGILTLSMLIITSCQLGPNKPNTSASANKDEGSEVKEVLQTSSYTYLRVEKQDAKQWIAVLRADFKVGEIVYFEKGLEMKNFESAELSRTFETVYFVDKISDKPMMSEMPMQQPGGVTGNQPQKPVLTKLDIKIEQPEGAVSIGELYKNRSQYSGKIVKVKGQVTKVNEGIMGRNWIHMQDGTADGDNFDLTVTTDDGPMIGEIITFSGTLNLNRDFGAGYTYELILEDAVPVSAR
jgi:hypothetical protein